LSFSFSFTYPKDTFWRNRWCFRGLQQMSIISLLSFIKKNHETQILSCACTVPYHHACRRLKTNLKKIQFLSELLSSSNPARRGTPCYLDAVLCPKNDKQEYGPVSSSNKNKNLWSVKNVRGSLGARCARHAHPWAKRWGRRQIYKIPTQTAATFEGNTCNITRSDLIHHFPYRWLSVGSELSYDHWSVAYSYTRYAPNIFGRACFFFLWRLVRPSQDGERTVPLANMPFGAKHANIAQHMRRLDCRVHEETPRPLKLTHVRSIKLWSENQTSVTEFDILT
jgi:hypothetical protein